MDATDISLDAQSQTPIMDATDTSFDAQNQTPIMDATNGTDSSSGAIEEAESAAAFDPQVIKDFLLDMSFDRDTLPYPRNQDLETMAMIKIANLGLSYQDIQPLVSVHKLCCHFAHSCFYHQPPDLKLYVAVYTWLLVGIDDLYLNSPEIQNFALKFGTGEPQGDPMLDCFARFLKYETPKLFGPRATNLILTSTLDGVNGHIIESMYPNGFPYSMSGFSGWVRGKSGYAEAYALCLFPEREFPESEWIGRYIQGLPNLRNVINSTNDILSFYKEIVLRRENCLISNLAEENGCDVIASLKALCAHTVENTHQIRKGYARETGVLLKAFNSFIDGYVKWHLETNTRYHLDEIGLSLKQLDE